MNKNKSVDKTEKRPLRIAELASAVILCGVFLFMFVYSLFFSRTERSIYDEQLCSMPEFTPQSLFKGDYTAGLSRYLTDTIHGRDEFKSRASKIRYMFGIPQDEFIIGGGEFPSLPDISLPDYSFDFSEEPYEESFVPEPSSEEPYEESSLIEPSSEEPSSEEPSSEEPLSEEPSSEEPSSEEPSSEEPSSEEPSSEEPSSEEPQIDETIFGFITVIGKGSQTRALEVFPALAYLEDTCAAYARRLDSFTAAVGDGVRVYSMVVPKSCAYYLGASKKYGHLQRNSLDVDNRIRSLLKKAEYVGAYHALEKHKDEEIYARTDFHWTGLGAYYAGEEFAKIAGVPYAPLDAYNINRRSGYYGNMYSATQHYAPIKDNPEDLITLVPKAEYKAYYYIVDYRYRENYTKNAGYSVFVPVSDSYVTGWYETHIGGDLNIVRIETKANTGRKLFIIKDSYGDALAPLFMSSFDEIYIADLRYMEIGALSFIKQQGITDVLFGISSNTACTSLNKHIERIMK